MISILDVLNNFISTRFNVKSRDRSFLLDSEQTSSPYSRMGIHFWHISCKITSSDASRSSLANIPFTARQKLRLAWSKLQSNLMDRTIKMPRYRISFTHEIWDPFLVVMFAQGLSISVLEVLFGQIIRHHFAIFDDFKVMLWLMLDLLVNLLTAWMQTIYVLLAGDLQKRIFISPVLACYFI